MKMVATLTGTKVLSYNGPSLKSFRRRSPSIMSEHPMNRLRVNIASLIMLRATDYILPLLTLPYLVRVLGVEKFGLITFAQAFVGYFAILVNYGFGLSATRMISVARDNPSKIDTIYSCVMLIQVMLMVVSLAVMSLIVFAFEKFRSEWIVYYLTFGAILGQVLIASWYFQGIEHIKFISNMTLSIRLFFAVMIFALVHEPNDYVLVPLLNGTGHLLAGVVSASVIFSIHNVKFSIPSWHSIRETFSESTQFFYSRVANDANQYYVTFILGITYGNVLVGYYAMIEKLYRALYAAITPITQAIYPYMAKTRDLIFFKRMFIFTVSIFAVLIAVSVIFNHLIIQFIFGISEQVASNIFVVLFSGTIFGVISSLIGYPFLAALGHIRPANSSLIYAAIVSFIYTNLSVYFGLSIASVAATLLLYEVMGCALRIYHINHLRLWRI